MEQDKLVEKKQEKFSLGVTILILLAALTIGEFMIASVGNNLALVLMLVALLKAWLIVRDYMHIGRLFSGEEDQG
jgi:hypothetical protein